MKKLLAVAAIVAAATLGTPARAAEDSGFTLALRSGFGIPMGEVTTGVNLSDGVSGIIPLWADVGYRFNKSIFVGGYFEYGLGLTKNCPAGASCSAHTMRFGVEGLYNFMPDASFAPWAGIGIGYEIAGATLGAQDATIKGFEFVNLQLGGDYKVSPVFSIGPFAAFSVASYSSASVGGVDVPNWQSGTHEWLQFGLKGTFNL